MGVFGNVNLSYRNEFVLKMSKKSLSTAFLCDVVINYVVYDFMNETAV